MGTMAQVSSERHDGDTAEQPSSTSYQFRPGPCPGGLAGPSWDGQTLTARPQQHKQEVQQSGEQVLHPHGGRTAGKVGRKLCSGPTCFERAPTHPLSWQLPANNSLPSHHGPRLCLAEGPSAPPREHRSFSLSAQTSSGISFPQNLSHYRPEGSLSPPPTRAGLQISAATAPPQPPHPSSAARCTLGVVVPAVFPPGGTGKRGHPTL